MLKRLKIVNSNFFHGFVRLISFILGPFCGNNQFFVHGEINHKKLKWVHAGHLAILKLLEHYLFQMAGKFEVVSPVTTRIFGCEQFYESFCVNFADLRRVIKIDLRQANFAIVFLDFSD